MKNHKQSGLKSLVLYTTPIYLLAVCVLAIVVNATNIFDDEVISLEGDMPRYLMNGAYLLDALRDLPLRDFFEYSTAYYAQYPALSLGHHPPLTSASEVPLYAIFGISVFSGKLTILCFMLLGSIMWYRLIQSLYGEHIAFLSTLLFITTPFIVEHSRVVMSEIPALALLITASYFFQQYLIGEKRKHLILFAISFALSVYAKQTAIILGLAFAWSFLSTKGIQKVFTPDILWSGVAFGIAMIPITVMTLGFSPSNIYQVTSSPMEHVLEQDALFRYAKIVWSHHLTPPVLIFSLVGMTLGLWKRDRRCYFFLTWIIVFYVVMTYLGTGMARFTIFWIPAFCLFPASLATIFPSRSWKMGMATIVLLISGGQAVMAYDLESSFARGYKEAAQYVVDNKKGTAVLYNAHIDTGYFIFYIRALDADRKMIVLLAEKLLVTSFLNGVIDDRIQSKDGIYKVLKDYGVCQVVLEDKPSKSRSIEWLREEVNTDRFFLKKTIPILTNDKRLHGVALKIYEYKSCGPPNPEATLEMDLPLIKRSIKVRYDNLVRGP